VNAFCKLETIQSPEAAAGHSQVRYPYPGSCCFVLLPSLDSVKSYDFIKFAANRGDRPFKRAATLPPVLARLAVILSCRLHDSVYLFCLTRINLMCRPTTLGIFACATTLILGFIFIQDSCIASNLFTKLHEIVKQYYFSRIRFYIK